MIFHEDFHTNTHKVFKELSMFERFTERARRAATLAQEESRNMGHNYVGTEHLLLGVSKEGEGIGAKALKEFGITYQNIKSLVVYMVGTDTSPQSVSNPFTPRSKKVLELALREALQLGHNYIGTEHILLGLIRESGGVAANVFRDFATDKEDIRKRVIEMSNESFGVSKSDKSSQNVVEKFVNNINAEEAYEEIEELKALGYDEFFVKVLGEKNVNLRATAPKDAIKNVLEIQYPGLEIR